MAIGFLFQRLTLEGDLVARDPLTLTLAGAASAASAVAGIAGTIMSAEGQMQAGKAAKSAEFFKAAEYTQQAQEERAAAQRSMFKERREGDTAQSRLQALSAASGAGADDPTVVNLAEGIQRESEYQALGEMFKGENRARGLEDESTAAIATGRAKMQGARYGAAGTVLSGASSMLDRFGGDRRRTASYG